MKLFYQTVCKHITKGKILREGEWGGFLEILYPSNIHVDKKITI